MAARDRADLRTRARVRADQVEGNKPTNAQYDAFLEECAHRVFSQLVGAGMPVDVTTQAITANGAATYSLNSGNPIFGVTSVQQLVGGAVLQLKRVDSGKLAVLRAQGVTSAAQPGFYEVRLNFNTGPVIEFLPRPAGGTFSVDYVLPFQGFANDAALWRGPLMSDELIVLYAAAKALRNEGEVADAAALDQEAASLLEQIATQASWLDMRGTPVIRNEEGGVARDAFDYVVAGPGY